MRVRGRDNPSASPVAEPGRRDCAPRYVRPRRRAGISLMEMLVTLVIVALAIGIATALLQRITDQSRQITSTLQRRTVIQNCLERMISEINEVGLSGRVEVDHRSHGYQVATHLAIIFTPDELGRNVARRIDWLAVPRYEMQDLVLFRREIDASRPDAPYVPVAYGLWNFYADFVSGQGVVPRDPNVPTPVIEIIAEIYQFDRPDPAHLLTFRRSHCLRRFVSPDLPDIDSEPAEDEATTEDEDPAARAEQSALSGDEVPDMQQLQQLLRDPDARP